LFIGEIYCWLKDDWRRNSGLSVSMILKSTPCVIFSSIDRMVSYNITNIVTTMNLFLYKLLRFHQPDYRSDLPKCNNASFIRSFMRLDLGGNSSASFIYIAYPSHTIRSVWPKTRLMSEMGRRTSEGWGVVYWKASYERKRIACVKLPTPTARDVCFHVVNNNIMYRGRKFYWLVYYEYIIIII